MSQEYDVIALGSGSVPYRLQGLQHTDWAISSVDRLWEENPEIGRIISLEGLLILRFLLIRPECLAGMRLFPEGMEVNSSRCLQWSYYSNSPPGPRSS
jgi:hypothetical protein